MNNNGEYLIQQVMPLLVQQIVGGIIVVVMLVWGFKSIRSAVRGEPIERIPI